jgi:hypothetical protein
VADVLFIAGVIAVALATFGDHAAASRRVAVAGAFPLIAANAGYLVWILADTAGSGSLSRDLALPGFWLSLAMWLAGAWFGMVAMRIVAILGIDRLGLTSSARPTIFDPIAMAGAALNGVAWVLLGIVVLRPGRDSTGVRPIAVDQPSSRA